MGIDLTDKVLILAKRNIDREYAQAGRPVDNVLILTHDIERIPSMLSGAAGDRVERIYINFCNPWNKRRGTKAPPHPPSSCFCTGSSCVKTGRSGSNAMTRTCLKIRCCIFPLPGFEITWMTRDLHADEPDWNIRTEHENMFTEMGIPTKALIARKVSLPQEP